MADLFLRKLSHTDTSIGTSPVLVKTVMCNADSCILVCLAIYKIECFIDVLFLKSFNFKPKIQGAAMRPAKQRRSCQKAVTVSPLNTLKMFEMARSAARQSPPNLGVTLSMLTALCSALKIRPKIPENAASCHPDSPDYQFHVKYADEVLSALKPVVLKEAKAAERRQRRQLKKQQKSGGVHGMPEVTEFDFVRFTAEGEIRKGADLIQQNWADNDKSAAQCAHLM